MLPSTYQNFIHMSRYSRYIEEFGRRERYNETVARYFDYMEDHIKRNHGVDISEIRKSLEQSVLRLDTMPSMRALMTAGPALERDHLAGYNCAYTEINSKRSFAEILYVLMCGTGMGFSVERQVIKDLPECPATYESPEGLIIVVEDSKEGWAVAYDRLIGSLYDGFIPKFDVSKVRPAGARLKTFGGRASGPAPLIDLFNFTISKFQKAAGRKLTSIECHDIATKIGDVVVVGGVRRSAMISLSNLSDDRMRVAKSGNWFETEKQRALANNSTAYTEKPDVHAFFKEWFSLYESKSGERGIFSRYGAKEKIKNLGRRDWSPNFGANPCAEILLRPDELCNLSEVVIRPWDTTTSIIKKVQYATILGTFQATLTNFNFVNNNWRLNCEEERLLGVSLTGIKDNMITSGQNGLQYLKDFLKFAREVAIETNAEWSKILGIKPSVAVTTVKPSGTVSQLVNCGSGIHDWFDEYFIRTVRADNKDPLCQFMMDSGVPYEACVSKPFDMTVFSFPMKAPDHAVLRSHTTAIQNLELVKIYNQYWTEHNVSVTINVREDEWPEVGGWVYKNFDEITGISFLPYDDHIYPQAPYQPCNKEQYEELMKSSPTSLDWNKFAEYENGFDSTQGSQTMACVGGVCEIVDLVNSPAGLATAN